MKAVVDSNVFMRGRSGLDYDELYTTSSVVEELETDKARTDFQARDVNVLEPSEDSLDIVKKESEKINSPTSDTDEDLVALTKDLDAVLVTDDLAVQNLSLRLGLSFESYMGEKIRESRKWGLRCENCGRKVSREGCGSCGSSRVRRKPG